MFELIISTTMLDEPKKQKQTMLDEQYFKNWNQHPEKFCILK